jgi:tetratricopeptide (TPR) repeat protein
MALGRAAAPSGDHWHWATPASVVAACAHSLAEHLRFREPDHARSLLVEHLTDVAESDVRGTAAFLQRSLGFLAVDRGDWTAARRWLDLSLDGARRSGSTRSEARSHQGLADLAWAQGELATAAAHATVALQLSSAAGHAYNLARAAGRLAEAQLDAGEVDAAQQVLTDTWTSVARHDRDASDKLLAPARARAARLSGDPDTARHLLARAARAQPADELRPERVTCLLETAALAVESDPAAALVALDRLASDAASIGLVLPAPDQARCVALRAAL